MNAMKFMILVDQMNSMKLMIRNAYLPLFSSCCGKYVDGEDAGMNRCTLAEFSQRKGCGNLLVTVFKKNNEIQPLAFSTNFRTSINSVAYTLQTCAVAVCVWVYIRVKDREETC